MTTAFQPMTSEQQTRFRSAYLDYLHRRDGVPDMKTNRFDVRERFFEGIDARPTCWVGTPAVDQATFDRNHARRRPEAGLDEATLWALATAKTNRAERYGVERSVEHDGAPPDASADPHAYIQIEEFYHTRILRDALATIGVRMEVGLPGAGTRMLVSAMVQLPEGLANVFVLGGEIFGVAVFSLLLEKARVLFRDQPAALARIEALFGQIMVDEVGHVHYVRSTLSAWQLSWAKRLLPVVAWGALDDIPELVTLFGRDEIMRRVRAANVDTAAASYPDRFVVPA